jgi:hypothetical protein
MEHRLERETDTTKADPEEAVEQTGSGGKVSLGLTYHTTNLICQRSSGGESARVSAVC